MAQGSYGICQEASCRLHSEVPAEEMDRSPGESSLPSSASWLRGAHVSNTSFGEELSFSSLLWTWSPGRVKLDAHLQAFQVSGVMCAHERSGASTKGFIYPASAGGLWCDREVWKKAGGLFSSVLTTEVVSPSRKNWLGNWCLSSVCSQIFCSHVHRLTEAKDSVALNEFKWTDCCHICAAIVQRILLFLGEIAEYCRLLPWCWMCVRVSGVHQWCLNKYGRNYEAPCFMERLKNCPFIVPVQQNVVSLFCKFHWNCDF